MAAKEMAAKEKAAKEKAAKEMAAKKMAAKETPAKETPAKEAAGQGKEKGFAPEENRDSLFGREALGFTVIVGVAYNNRIFF